MEPCITLVIPETPGIANAESLDEGKLNVGLADPLNLIGNGCLVLEVESRLLDRLRSKIRSTEYQYYQNLIALALG